MDALALLCTLHADGPATLKRLRARGYSDLVTLIQRSSEDLSADLGVEPAYARRLLREAKLLAVRVGAEGLEAEEAPPVASTAPVGESVVSEPMPPTIPIERSQEADTSSALNASDRSLVERIVGQQPSAPVEAVLPEPAAVPVHVPKPELAAEPEPEIEPEPEPVVVEEPGLFTAGSLPGLDAELVADLHASGIRSLSDLASAESLALTRALGITFAQARRLGFLARRAAAEVEVEAPRSAPVAPVAAPEVAPAPKAAPAPVHIPAPSVVATPVPAPAPAPVASAEPSPKSSEEPSDRAAQESPAPEEAAGSRPFWEPRKFLTDSAGHETAPDQGVKVDPSEIAPRPRFGDRLAQAAARNRAAEAGSPEAPADRSPRSAASGQTVLGWNFEIPRPVEEPSLPLGSVAVPEDEASVEAKPKYTPEYSAGVSVPRPAVPRPAPRDQDHGGPFA